LVVERRRFVLTAASATNTNAIWFTQYFWDTGNLKANMTKDDDEQKIVERDTKNHLFSHSRWKFDMEAEVRGNNRLL